MNRRTFLAAASALFLPYEPERVYSFGENVGRLPERAHGIESWFPEMAPVYFRTKEELDAARLDFVLELTPGVLPFNVGMRILERAGFFGTTLLSPRARGEELSRGANASQYAGQQVGELGALREGMCGVKR